METDLKIAIIHSAGDKLAFIHSALVSNNCEVFSYSSAEEALSKLHIDVPNVLIMDLDIPKLNGITVCDALREDPKFYDLPIILVSGSKTDIGDFNLYFKGIDFMQKPINSAELIGKIRLYHHLRTAYAKVAEMYSAASSAIKYKGP